MVTFEQDGTLPFTIKNFPKHPKMKTLSKFILACSFMLVACGEDEALDERPLFYENAEWTVFAVEDNDTISVIETNKNGGMTQSFLSQTTGGTGISSLGGFKNHEGSFSHIGGVSLSFQYSSSQYDEDVFMPRNLPQEFYVFPSSTGNQNLDDSYGIFYDFYPEFRSDPFVTISDSVKVVWSKTSDIYELTGHSDRTFSYQDYSVLFQYQVLDTLIYPPADTPNRVLDISIYGDIRARRDTTVYN